MAMNHLPSALPTNSWEWHEDEVVEELHQRRAQIAERFDCDLDRVYEYYLSVPILAGVSRAALKPVIPGCESLGKLGQ
jgi:hypothetical protein